MTRRILLIRLGGLGDVAFTLPAVNAIKLAFPQARIDFLTYREFAPLLRGFPHVDSVLELDRSHYRGLNPRKLLPAVFGLLRALRRSKFDLAVDFQGFGETGLATWWTGAPHRWGGVYRSTRGWPYSRAVRRNSNLHPVDYQLDMLQRCGGISPSPVANEFILPESALEQGRQFFADRGLQMSRPTFFIQPFSNGVHKNWPLDGYLEIATHWADQGMQVVFGGGPADRETLEPARSKGFPVAAGAPLLVSAALASLSTVVLGGDTGLLHVSVALGKRVVMIISSTRPGDCFPYGHPEWAVVPEKGTYMWETKPQVIIEACARALAEVRSRWSAAAPVLAPRLERV